MGSWQMPTDLVNSTQGLLEGTAKWAYNVSHGTFWAALLLGFSIVLGLASFKYGQERAIGFGSFAGLFGALLLVSIGLMSWFIASIFIIVGAVGITYMILNR